MTFRHVLALAMTAFLTCNSLTARTTALGVIIAANRAHLTTIDVTAGATVFEGDRYSTESRGTLSLRGGTAMLQLAEESTLTMRSRTDHIPGMEAELSRGTLAFETSGASHLGIAALEAHICPATEAQTTGQVRIVNPKELIVSARRGDLRISYRGETAKIAEGKSYRVILDPPEQNPKQPKRFPKGFKIVIIGEAAAIVGLGIHELLEHESPDRP